MLNAYQLDRAQRNLSGYAVLGIRSPLGVRALAPRGLSGANCGCACSGRCKGTLKGLGAVAPISAQDAMNQAMQGVANLNPKDFQNPTWTAKALSQIENGQFDMAWAGPGCGTQAAPNLNLFSTASGLALSSAGAGIGIADATVTGFAAGTGALLGAATMGAGLLISVIGMIFAHHAAAVKQEQQIFCAALPAFNNAMSVIQSAVQNGQTTPASAASSLDSLYSNYRSYIAPSYGTSPYCNANCEMAIIAKAITLFWQAQFSAMAAQQAAAPAAQQSSQIVAASAPATASVAAQPGSGSAGSGPVTAPAINSGSTLVIPQAQPAAAPSIPGWLMLVGLAIGGWAIAEAF